MGAGRESPPVCAAARAGGPAGARVRRTPAPTRDRSASASRSGRGVSEFRGRSPSPRGGVSGARDRARQDSYEVSCFAIDEIAIEGELTNERVDLAERQWRGEAAFKIPTEKAVRRHAEIKRR